MRVATGGQAGEDALGPGDEGDVEFSRRDQEGRLVDDGLGVVASDGGESELLRCDPEAMRHEQAGIGVAPAQRDHHPEGLGPVQEAPPRSPVPASSAAVRSALAMRSTGSARSVIATSGSGRSVI